MVHMWYDGDIQLLLHMWHVFFLSIWDVIKVLTYILHTQEAIVLSNSTHTHYTEALKSC